MTALRAKQRLSLSLLLDGMTDTAVAPDIEVSRIAADSRQVQPRSAFFATQGTRVHGMRFVRDAISNGAIAVVYDPLGEGAQLASATLENNASVVFVPVPELGQKLGVIADRFFNSPSSRLKVIAVTGTNAKTTVSHALAQALSEKNPCGVVGTLGWGLRGNMHETWHTTPDSVALHSILSELEGMGATAVSMEVSSHGLEQGRVQGVRFLGAVFTNITRDHLDYHGTMEAYVAAKLRLLRAPGLQFAVVNLDDQYASQILATVPDGVRAYGFTCKDRLLPGVCVVAARNIRHGPDGLSFDVNYASERARVSTPLFGDFNVENLAATLAVLLAMGQPFAEAVQRIGTVSAVPGRMERFVGGDRSTTAIVDYAHTPDALERVLKSLRVHCRGELWLVFGCGGDRDRGKRPLMGAIAERFADHVVIADDNPRSEDGNVIVQEILRGCAGAHVDVIRDRTLAIKTAIGRASPDDIVVVAGKGHETTQEINGIKYPFCDRSVVRDALAAESQSAVGGPA